MTGTDVSNEVFQLALQFVNQTAQSVFLTGKAGTGKTTFLRHLKSTGSKNMVIVAPTGVAAINAGGVTMHSFFQLPFLPFIPGEDDIWNENTGTSNEYQLLKNIRFSEVKRELIQELDLLVIDEVSMLRADMLDAIDSILRSYRGNSKPFGGIQVLFIGDLFQLPPVINKTEWELLQSHYDSPFFFEAKVIRQAPPVYIELQKIYRQKDAAFIDLLNHIRHNQLNVDDYELLKERFDPGFIPAKGMQYITLTTHNARADTINRQELEKIASPGYGFEAELTGDFDIRSVTAEKSLLLKKDAQVMFVKNDKGENRRYFNGKIGTVTRISGTEIFIKFPDEPGELLMEKETWKNIRYKFDRERGKVDEETVGSFTQYPVRLAWAITIHKSQGLTFDRAIIDAGASFAPGQVYVALSRLTSLEGLVLYSRIEPRSISTDERIKSFSTQETTERSLQDQLKEQQQVFLLRTVADIFQFAKLASAIRDHSVSYEHRKIPEKELAARWAVELDAGMRELMDISEKFSRQLAQLLPAAREDGYQNLQLRVRSATSYFNNGLDRLTESVSRHQELFRIKHHSKNYVKELFLLKKLLLRKKQQLDHIVQVIDGLVNGTYLSILLGSAGPAAEPIPETEKVEKIKKGETCLISLRLFKDHKSIDAVAKLRGLTSGTVETHLISFIGTGNIEIGEFVEAHKIKTIRELVQQTGTTQVVPLKQKLGDDFSFNEIRAVVKFCLLSTADPKVP